MARQIDGHIGNFTSVADLTNRFPPAEYAGCSANYISGAVTTKYWSDGTQWAAAAGGATGTRVPSGLISGDTSAGARATNASILQTLFASPGKVTLPAGDFCCDPFTISATVRVEGQGGNWGIGSTFATTVPATLAAGGVANTILRFTSTTNNFITITANAVEFGGGIHFEGAANATAGAAIRVGNGPAVPADRVVIRNTTFRGFFTGIDIISSAGYTIADNNFLGQRGYGLRISNESNVDYGDPSIYGNTFNATYAAPAAIYIKGGGGAKIYGNKINWASLTLTDFATYCWRKGIHVDNPTGATSVLVITGNSIENIDQQGIFVDCSTTGSYSNIVVSGNEFFNIGNRAGESTIEVSGRSGTLLHCVTVGNNVFHATRTVKMTYVESGGLFSNTWYAIGGSAAFLILGVGTSGVDYYPQNGSNLPTQMEYFSDSGGDTAWNSLVVSRGNRIHKYTREIPGVTSNASYSDLFVFRVPPYGAVTLKADFTISSSGNGQASLSINRLIANEAGAGTIGIIGTDSGVARVSGTTAVQTIGVSATNPICGDADVTISTSLEGQVLLCRLSIKRSASAAGTQLTGMVTVDLNGAVKQISRA